MGKRSSFLPKSLLMLASFAAVLCACALFLRQEIRRDLGLGAYRSFEEWPRSLREMIASEASLMNDVEPYGLSGLIDHKSIWRITPGSPLRQRLFDKNTYSGDSRPS